MRLRLGGSTGGTIMATRGCKKTAKKVTKKTAKKKKWREYELIVRAIYDALMREHRLDQWEVKHNVKVEGLGTTHQIDVHCKFRLAEQVRQTIIQVKRKKKPAEQTDLLAFHRVLDDIPGRPGGIFVTHAGYQAGALNYAKKWGIELVQLVEVERSPPIQMPLLSVMRVHVRFDTLLSRYTMRTAVLNSVNILCDGDWSQEQGLTGIADFSGHFELVRFCDAAGTARTSVREEAQRRIQEIDGEGTAQIDLEFSEPVFMEGFTIESPRDFPLTRLKIQRFSATMSVTETSFERPVRSEEYVTYALKNVLEGSTRYVLILPREAEPQAIVRVRLKGTRQVRAS